MPQHYLFAVFSPLGRLSPLPFAFMVGVLSFTQIYLVGQMSWYGALEGWDGYATALAITFWMTFCIFSRRLRDTGSSGMIMVPVFFAALGVLTLSTDPESPLYQVLDNPIVVLWGDIGLRLASALYLAIVIYCAKAQGEEGPNAYGPAFGESRDTITRKPAFDDQRYSQEPVHAYIRPGEREITWGKRSRPTGFGRRSAA